MEQPHRRLNILTKDWVLVSPHRAKRPWQGSQEKVAPGNLPQHDPKCYLCPGNPRSAGQMNPTYTSTFVFDNDFSALLPPEEEQAPEQNEFFVSEPVHGKCRVVCFSPRHDLALPLMKEEEIVSVIATWTAESEELGALPFIKYVQVFENKGAAMGCSNPHPHSQIWSCSSIPVEPEKELAAAREYSVAKSSCILCDYLKAEKNAGSRIVCTNDHFTVVVPFWAVWPYETLLIPHRHVSKLAQLSPEEVRALANILKRMLTRFDNLFECPFPYSMGFHQSPYPSDEETDRCYHLHLHVYPPLLRSASVKKFMVGFELLGMPQRDITAEAAVERLLAVSDSRHYTENM